MRVTIIAIGWRGDVQPCVALGIGLRNAGHDVRLATHPRFESLVRDFALDFAPVAEGKLTGGAETPEGRRWLEIDSKALPGWVGLLRDAKSVARQRLADCRDACEGTDAIVVTQLGTLLGYQLAEHIHVPLVRAYLAPMGVGRLGGGLTRQVIWLSARPWVNAARREVLELPPLPVREFSGRLEEQRTPLLSGWSPAVYSPPNASDWEHVTGYWFLDRPADWEPPAPLVEFLAAGPPPVYVGFGSMADRDPEGLTAVTLEALSRTGQRGIVPRASLPPKGADLPPGVFAIDAVWHDWLFPRVAAAVNHGGAGTTSQALRAGTPSVIIPSFVDQPFWADQVHGLELSPPPIPRKQLSAERLEEAIRVVTTDAGLRERCTAFADRIRSEDGVARAVEEFEHHMGAAGHDRGLSRVEP